MAARRSHPGPALLILAAACLPACRAAGADDAPRTLMRLPGWVQTLGDVDGRPPKDDLPQTSRQPEFDSRPVADWSDSGRGAGPIGTAAPPPRPTAPGGRRAAGERIATTQATEPGETPRQPVGAAAAERAGAPDLPDDPPTLTIDQASFRGVSPGTTTRGQLEAEWGSGEAFARADGRAGLAWEIRPFRRVEVTLADDVVESIGITLDERVPLADLARQLEIADVRTVPVRDDQGRRTGESYPERGVIIGVEPDTDTATTIRIEPLDPDAFVARAEAEVGGCSAHAVADLRSAVTIDPRHVRAHRLLLAMECDRGAWDEALRLVEAAVDLDPQDVWTRLKHASVLLAVDRPDDAEAALARAASLESSSPLVLAQTARLSGRILLARPTPDCQAAVDRFGEAIRRASPLLDGQPPIVQAAAREVLLDAHLGTALAIARGSWQQKSRVIPKWISRADTVVRQFTGAEEERQVLELQLCRGALAAAAESTDAIEPLPWVKRLLELRDTMGAEIADPWRRRQVDWDVGQGLADALTAAQKRGDATDMLDNATLTAAYLERGAGRRELTAGERKRLGDLIFRVGILHSLQRGDHATAVTWFDRIEPLWTDNDAFERAGELGRLGEAYVSMAISYWQVGRRDDAMAYSSRGVDLMVAAVDAGQLDERALAVAYGNLATMHAEQGDDSQARTYAEMASRAEATGALR